MPFEVAVQIKVSPIQGKGIFALEKIQKGQIFWTFKTTPNTKQVVESSNEFIGENVILDEVSLRARTQEQISGILHGGYPHGNSMSWIQLNDGSQFTNHSDNPNGECTFEDDVTQQVTYALRDIEIGEEITENYRTCMQGAKDWIARIWTEYNYETHFFMNK